MLVSLILPYYNRKKYLEATLESLTLLYGRRSLERFKLTGRDLEIIIVDDGSNEEHRVEDVVAYYSHYLTIKLIRLENKDGINPCKPYNVGARHASGEVLILSSPETIHLCNVFEDTDDFKNIKGKYFCFSVFCPTDPAYNEALLNHENPWEACNRLYGTDIGVIIEEDVGEKGYESFANGWGSWYLHEKYRPSALNFFSALTKDLYFELCGFDERFRGGTGFDDNEFRDRLLARIGKENVKYFNGWDVFGLHLNHPPVYGKGDPISNQALYLSLKDSPYHKNDDWGRMGS